MMWMLLLGVVGIGMAVGDFGSSSSRTTDDADDGTDTGSSGEDVLTGTDQSDLIFGEAGDDAINGHGGDDLLLGGAGNDLIRGESGDDVLIGGAGDDTLLGGPGEDLLLDGPGNDVLEGNGNDDVLIAMSGADALHGGNGDDVLIAIDMPAGMAPGNTGLGEVFSELEDDLQELMDEAFGTAAEGRAGTVLSEAVAIGPGAQGATGDQLYGGNGDDLLVGDSHDTLDGGAGSDEFIIMAAREDHYYTAPGYQPVQIDNYEAGEPIWLAYIDAGPAAPPTLSSVQDGDDVMLRLDGITVAVVGKAALSDVNARAVGYREAADTLA